MKRWATIGRCTLPPTRFPLQLKSTAPALFQLHHHRQSYRIFSEFLLQIYISHTRIEKLKKIEWKIFQIFRVFFYGGYFVVVEPPPFQTWKWRRQRRIGEKPAGNIQPCHGRGKVINDLVQIQQLSLGAAGAAFAWGESQHKKITCKSNQLSQCWVKMWSNFPIFLNESCWSFILGAAANGRSAGEELPECDVAASNTLEWHVRSHHVDGPSFVCLFYFDVFKFDSEIGALDSKFGNVAFHFL